MNTADRGTAAMGASAAGERRVDLDVDPDLQRRLHDLRDKEQAKEALRRQVWKERRVLLPLLGLTLALLPNFRMAQVQGRSMYPAYSEGDRLVMLKTYKTFSPLKVGDVVVIRLKDGKYKGEEWVKRVVFIQNAQGNAAWPEYMQTFRGEVPTRFLFPQYWMGIATVPPNQIMVMGDNLMNSTDSRDADIGAISPDEVIGKVLNN